MIKEPNNVQSDIDDERVAEALKLINSQFQAYSDRNTTLESLKQLDNDVFEVAEPTGRDKLPSGLPRQVINKILGQITIPSSSYHCDDASEYETVAVRNAIEYILDEGGFEEAFLSKPSIARDAFMYGDGFVRVGLDNEANVPVKFDNIDPTSLFVDSNATVMRTKRGTRSVQKIAMIDSFDYAQAVSMYDAKFGKGAIPRSTDLSREFIKTQQQDTNADENTVEICHYFDISDKKNPVHMIFAGQNCTIIEENEGKSYPFWMDDKTPFIPVGQFLCFPSNEGFYNFGLLHVFYKYAKIRQQLINKLINQSLNNMSDINVLNVGMDDEGLYIQKIREAKKIREKGESPFIINDSGKEISITQLQREEFNQSLEQMYSDLDREIKRWGIDLDSIREGTSATATQIRLEAEAQSEFVQMIVDINTQFFEFIHQSTMAIIRKYVPKKDKRKVPVNVEMEKIKRDEQGETVGVEKDKMGQTVKEEYKSATLGEISELLNEYEFRVEINTKTGVVEKDTLKTARWSEMTQFAGANPLLLRNIVTNMAKANNLKLDDSIWDSMGQQMQGEQAMQQAQMQQMQGQMQEQMPPEQNQAMPQQVLPTGVMPPM